MNKPLVLVVDDEPQIRKLLSVVLESANFKVALAENGKDGVSLCANLNPDAVLLDIGLPDKPGIEILTEIRKWYSRPIIMLSILNDEDNIVRALDLGANDYLSKPFRSGELIARLKVAARNLVQSNFSESMVFDDLSIDIPARMVFRNAELIKLTSKEFELLALLSKNVGRVLTHQFILNEIWGVNHQNDTQYLRVFIATLRKKIEVNPNQPVHIITESRVGYRFN
jgi:two-component system KDP operon response regulator KdpE